VVKMSAQVWTKLFQSEIYIVVYHDPWQHSECDEGCCAVDTTEVLGTASSFERAEELIQRYLKRMTCYQRKDFEIIVKKLDGELR